MNSSTTSTAKQSKRSEQDGNGLASPKSTNLLETVSLRCGPEGECQSTNYVRM